MKKVITSIFIIILIAAGLSLLLYPMVSNQWNTYRQSQLITSYDQTVKQMEQASAIDYDTEWQDANSYNAELLPTILPDSFAIAAVADEPDEEYMSCLNLTGDGMMGYVEIPKIDIKIPIYHTVEEEVLQNAAGHLEGSSLPVGGESTHSVISAHRGLPQAALFTDLDRLSEGDNFLLHVLDDTLCYEVDKISVVDPEETDALQVEDGQDLCTLLTCTPYGVNTQRLLVRGHRVPYEAIVVADESVPLMNMSVHTNYMLWVVVGLAIAGGFILLLAYREKRLRKRIAERKRTMDIVGMDKMR